MLGSAALFPCLRHCPVSMNVSVSMGWSQMLIPRPQPDAILEAIRSYRPTFTPLVPTMYIGMLSHPDLEKNGYELH